MHISLCGHAVHQTCFDSYIESVKRGGTHNSNEHTSLDLLNGEFACPICKRLSNGLVPFSEVRRGWVYGGEGPRLKEEGGIEILGGDDDDEDDDDKVSRQDESTNRKRVNAHDPLSV